jgi:hypothetical protein
MSRPTGKSTRVKRARRGVCERGRVAPSGVTAEHRPSPDPASNRLGDSGFVAPPSPPGPTPAEVQQVMNGMQNFAQCTHAHGIPNWPGPSLDVGRPTFDIHGIDYQASRISTAIHDCQHLILALHWVRGPRRPVVAGASPPTSGSLGARFQAARRRPAQGALASTRPGDRAQVSVPVRSVTAKPVSCQHRACETGGAASLTIRTLTVAICGDYSSRDGSGD